MKIACLLLTLLFVTQLAPALRIATYNASLNRTTEGRLITDLSTPGNTQARRVAEIIQRLAPDIILINEFDYDADGQALALFHDNYLAVSQNEQPSLSYPHRYAAESNTGLPTDFSFDFGFGNFPGQFGMAVYSKFPIRLAEVRTFQKFLWKDMPGNLIPSDFYTPEQQEIFRLSSKSHWDLPIDVDGQVIHILASHPTPPVFDGAEDRNGKRNHDEIRLWADYISNKNYLYDDAGLSGGLVTGSRFVIMGDQNADPVDGDSVNGAINQLLKHPAVNDTQPASDRFGTDTADFNSGDLRVDYVLPSRDGFKVDGSGVYWPTTNPERVLIRASDHRPVWVDLTVIPMQSEAFENLQLDQNSKVLSWNDNASLAYQIERSFSLRDDSWELFETPIIISEGEASAALQQEVPRMFYRVRADFR